MNISENLQLLLDTKSAIRTSINNKGVELESSAPFSAYSSAIDSIQTGGGSDTPLVKQLIQHSGATFVDIPSGTTRIGDYAFYKCMELSGVSIPDSVTSIGVEAFTLSSGLESITVPDSVTSIGQSAFRQCSGLTTITISSGVTSIGSFALYTCPSLTEIRIEATVPPTIGSGVFAGTNNCPIYVPCESVDDYKAASGWSEYASRIEGYDCQEPDPCDEDPCSDPECPGYDPVECGECDNDPCVSPDCPGYDECACEGTGCPDPCDEDPCSDPSCPGYVDCDCVGYSCDPNSDCYAPDEPSCNECWDDGWPSGVDAIWLTQGEQARIYFGPFDPAGSRYQSRAVHALSNCDCSDQQVESSWEVEYDTNDNLAGVSPSSNNLAYVANSVYEGVYDENDPSNNEDGYIDVEALTDGWWYFCADGFDIDYVEKLENTCSDPCSDPGCDGYDECACEGTGCPEPECDPCDENGDCYDQWDCACSTAPCDDPDCPNYDECACDGINCPEGE